MKVDVVWCGDVPLLCLLGTTPDLHVPKLVSVACVKVGLVGGSLSPDPEAAP